MSDAAWRVGETRIFGLRSPWGGIPAGALLLLAVGAGVLLWLFVDALAGALGGVIFVALSAIGLYAYWGQLHVLVLTGDGSRKVRDRSRP